MKVVFRVDAAHHIGTGHVMRCLTLADHLSARGAECVFICREHQGHMLDEIRRRGYAAHGLRQGEAPARLLASVDESVFHASWLGVGWREDSVETRAVLEALATDWLVVDHYGLDADWERELRPYCRQLMAIDDLADRLHDCDLLLDQTPGRDVADYRALVPEPCRLLTGSRYALVRAEFSAQRDRSRERRQRNRLDSVLVFMGGADPQNATGKILRALKESRIPPDVRLTVVMRRSAPWLAAVRDEAASLAWPTDVLTDVADMAELMAESDLALGAAGTASWERCALGLPSIVLETAPNQRFIGRSLGLAGAHWFLGPIDELSPAQIGAVVGHAAIDGCALAAMHSAALQICDGRGASRVASALFDWSREVEIRPATMDDAELLHGWRNHPSVRQHVFDPAEIAFADHLAWLARCISDESRVLLVASCAGTPAASVRFDIDEETAVVSIYMNPEFIGRGIGAMVLESAIVWFTRQFHEVRKLRAHVRPDNDASHRLFLRTGFAACYHGYEKSLS